MTLWRQPAHALSILLLASSLASLANAAEPPKAAKPAAPKPAAAWLRTERAPAKPVTAPSRTSPLRLSLLAMLVVGLGGSALFLRRRRKVIARAVRSDLEVLSAARVGAKAEVVVVSVGGRKVLLGVTDAQVSQLGWLDDELEGSALPEEVPAFAAAARRPMLEAAPPSAAALQTVERAPAPPRRFRDALLSALGQNVRPEPVNAALAIAESTEDFVSRSDGRSPVRAPAGAPAMVDVEGQAKGLVLRLQKRA